MGQRYLGEPLASRPPDGVKRSNHTCPPGPCSRGTTEWTESFPEPGSVSHTETLNSCRHTSSVCGDAAGKLSHSQPQAELEAYSIWRQKGSVPRPQWGRGRGEGERGEGGGRREEGGTQALRHPVRGSPPRKQHSLPWLTQEKFFFSHQITINRTGNIRATFKPGKSIIFVQQQKLHQQTGSCRLLGRSHVSENQTGARRRSHTVWPQKDTGKGAPGTIQARGQARGAQEAKRC